ncbi:MAG: hypothetical protein K2Y23_21385 [Cyanobacteria bacterium]|nr:hypothetical protein [Cyanobacteriota bacterium]
MSFESCIAAFCDRHLSQRTFELVVAPALADLEFEDARARCSHLAGRAAVLRAVLGGLRLEIERGSADFFKLTLLSVSYFMFPVAVSGSIFKTWTDFFIAAAAVLVMSLAPVIICFWPERRTVRD